MGGKPAFPTNRQGVKGVAQPSLEQVTEKQQRTDQSVKESLNRHGAGADCQIVCDEIVPNEQIGTDTA